METARSRAGFFTPAEALAHHISPQLLRYRVARGWVHRELRGVYRFAGVPPAEHDDLLALWLWSGEDGVFSHITALALHHLSDALPAKIHMTVPTSWRHARFSRPKPLVLHLDDLPGEAIQWLGHVRITTVVRTLADCIATKVSSTLIEQGLAQARSRKLISTAQHAELRRTHRRSTS
jgi:predicted transcriptional regulator of viral defense system